MVGVTQGVGEGLQNLLGDKPREMAAHPHHPGEYMRFIVVIESSSDEDPTMFAEELAESIQHIYAEDVTRIEVIHDADEDMFHAF